MELILLTIVVVVGMICYTVYKIDRNRTNKSENYYYANKLKTLETKPMNPTKCLGSHKSLSKPTKDKGTRIPPGKDSEQ
ncbi:hypothetical protein [Staphylococcus haemolyticus]